LLLLHNLIFFPVSTGGGGTDTTQLRMLEKSQPAII